MTTDTGFLSCVIPNNSLAHFRFSDHKTKEEEQNSDSLNVYGSIKARGEKRKKTRDHNESVLSDKRRYLAQPDQSTGEKNKSDVTKGWPRVSARHQEFRVVHYGHRVGLKGREQQKGEELHSSFNLSPSLSPLMSRRRDGWCTWGD